MGKVQVYFLMKMLITPNHLACCTFYKFREYLNNIVCPQIIM